MSPLLEPLDVDLVITGGVARWERDRADFASGRSAALGAAGVVVGTFRRSAPKVAGVVERRASRDGSAIRKSVTPLRNSGVTGV